MNGVSLNEKFLILALVVLVQSQLATSELSFDKFYNYSVYRAKEVTPDEVQQIEGFADSLGSSERKKFFLNDLPLYDDLRRTSFGMRISQFNRESLLTFLNDSSIAYELTIEDFGVALENEYNQNMAACSDASCAGDFQYDRFNSIQLINAWMRRLVKDFASSNKTSVSLVNISTTSLNRTILALNITSKHYGGNKDMIVMEGGLIPYDWLTPASITKFVGMMLGKVSMPESLSRVIKDPKTEIKKILQYYHLIIIPVLNVDGYEYTHSVTGDREWPRNRQIVGEGCVGIHLNRNWDYAYNSCFSDARPSIRDACERVYFCGTKAFESPELAGYKAFFEKYKKRIKIYMNMHRYSVPRTIGYPYFSTTVPSNHTEADLQRKAAEKMRDQIKLLGLGSPFRVENAAERLTPIKGTSLDWVYSQGVIYSLHIQLGKTKSVSYVANQSDIDSVSRELFVGFQALVEFVHNDSSSLRRGISYFHVALFALIGMITRKTLS